MTWLKAIGAHAGAFKLSVQATTLHLSGPEPTRTAHLSATSFHAHWLGKLVSLPKYGRSSLILQQLWYNMYCNVYILYYTQRRALTLQFLLKTSSDTKASNIHCIGHLENDWLVSSCHVKRLHDFLACPAENHLLIKPLTSTELSVCDCTTLIKICW